MKKPLFTITILMLFVLIGCAQSSDQSLNSRSIGNEVGGETDDYAVEEVETFSLAYDGETSDDADRIEIGRTSLAQVQERLIIKHGELEIEVDDIDASTQHVISFTNQLGGYVANQNISGYDQYRHASLTLNVPVETFDGAMSEFRSLGIVERESVNGEDVTEEFVDLTSQLENLQATQTRMRELLNEAENVEETLEVDRELRQIEGEMNRIQGRMKFLRESAAFSTISLYISATADEPYGQDTPWGISPVIQEATDDFVVTFQGLVDGITYFAIAVLPFLLVFAAFVWVSMRIIRAILGRFRPKNSADSSNSAENLHPIAQTEGNQPSESK